MTEQIARMRGAAAAVEISGGGGGRKTLHARPDRHRNHVLLQPLVETDAGVAASRQHVDKAVFGDHLELDVRMGGEKRRRDRGQHQPHRADRDVEAKRTRRPLAKAVHHIERGVHLGHCRAEPFEEPRPRLSRNDAAGGAVVEPHAQLRFEPAHRFAQSGRAHAAGACTVAITAGARHRQKRVQIA